MCLKLFSSGNLTLSVWIGLYYKDQQNPQYSTISMQWTGWKWSDNSPMKYQNWAKDAPSKDLKNKCGILQGVTGTWHDYYCTFDLSYICEIANSKPEGNIFKDTICVLGQFSSVKFC